jgi:plasmid stabilization system protein ParE
MAAPAASPLENFNEISPFSQAPGLAPQTGMLGGTPNAQQLLSVLGKYDPKAALTAQVSMANTEEKTRSAEAINTAKNEAAAKALEAKLEGAIDLLKQKNDATSQMLTQKLEATLDQLRLRADLTGGMGKPPSGYRKTADGELEAIPGGPADVKKQEKYVKDTAAVDSMASELDRLATQANMIKEHPGLGNITGLMGAIPNVPGGKAADAESLLSTLKSQTAFSVLQTMRNNSKTGGALGQVSDKEGELLQNNLAALSKAQSLKQYKESLQQIIDYTQNAKERIRKAHEMQWGEKKPEEGKPSAQPRFKIKAVR